MRFIVGGFTRPELIQCVFEHLATQAPIQRKIWAKRPWTGSTQGDTLLRYSMDVRQAELLMKANEERMELLNQFYDVMLSQ